MSKYCTEDFILIHFFTADTNVVKIYKSGKLKKKFSEECILLLEHKSLIL